MRLNTKFYHPSQKEEIYNHTIIGLVEFMRILNTALKQRKPRSISHIYCDTYTNPTTSFYFNFSNEF